MNCKPGDLAVIVGLSPLVPEITGRIVEVLHAAPIGVEFRLPDGKLNQAAAEGFWVVKFQNPVQVALEGGGRRTALYGCCPDRRLRPLRDDPGADETLNWVTLPRPVRLVEPA